MSTPPRSEAVVDGSVYLALRDADRDSVAEVLADVLLAALEAEDRETSNEELVTTSSFAKAGAAR